MRVIKGREKFVPKCPYLPPGADEARRMSFVCGGGRGRACRICPSRATPIRLSREELVEIGAPSFDKKMVG